MNHAASHARKRLAPLVAALLALCAVEARAANGARYSSLQNCRTVERLKLAERVFQQGVFRCAGVGGYSVYVVEDDPRSFLALQRGKKLFSLEKPMSTEFAQGNLPNVSGATKAEWRIDDAGKAVALIVRVAYQTEGEAKPASTLLAFDLRGDAPVLIGAAATNEEARKLADAEPGAADEEALSRECNAIYADLCKDLPAGPERLGRCYDRRPAIAEKIPSRCVADFQTNVENYHQAVGGGN